MIGNFTPTFFNNFPNLVKNHFSILNSAKDIFPILGTDCYEIETILTVIPVFQSFGTESKSFFEIHKIILAIQIFLLNSPLI